VTRRIARIGLVVTVALATLGARSSDGPVIDPDYQWVAPPAEVAATNTIPIPTSVAVSPGTATATVATADRQLVLRVDTASIGDEPVVVTMTPVDPADLAPLPDGASQVGNAYRVDTSTVADFPASFPATALLVAPRAADSTYGLSSDGRAWRRLGASGEAVASELPTTLVIGAAATGETTGVPLVVVVGLLAAFAALAASVLLMMRRRFRRVQSNAIDARVSPGSS
jgi:hypothetical protein